ncbi:MAG: DUF1573 domain-containing protein [Planctomycetota bacterium]|nr:MAG: DUF1573 domain-containing protein [Planctomycetota bacterium]
MEPKLSATFKQPRDPTHASPAMLILCGLSGFIIAVIAVVTHLCRIDLPAHRLSARTTIVATSDGLALAPRSRVRGAVWVKNSGRQPVMVKQIRSSCDCTVVSNVKDILLNPGQSVRIEIETADNSQGSDAILTIETEPMNAKLIIPVRFGHVVAVFQNLVLVV